MADPRGRRDRGDHTPLQICFIKYKLGLNVSNKNEINKILYVMYMK